MFAADHDDHMLGLLEIFQAADSVLRVLGQGSGAASLAREFHCQTTRFGQDCLVRVGDVVYFAMFDSLLACLSHMCSLVDPAIVGGYTQHRWAARIQAARLNEGLPESLVTVERYS